MARSFPAVTLIDRIAIALSGLCLAHCIATIAAIALMSGGTTLLLDPHIHHVGIAIALLLGVGALGHGVYRHGARRPLVFGIAGLTLMAVALLMSDHGWQEAAITSAGVSLLALAHHQNRRALDGTRQSA